MIIMFQGFPEKTIPFFLDLRFHNDSTWFHAHYSEYESAVRKPFYELIETLAPTALEIAPDMEVRPVRCLSRINRDVRFSRDKSPYRDHMWLLLRRAGEERDQSVMYWFELSPETVTWGLGFWGPNRPAMDALRKQMELHPSQVVKAVKQAKLPSSTLLVCGDSYKKLKVPPDLPKELQTLYPLKEIYIQRANYPLSNIYTSKLAQDIAHDYLQLRSMYSLLRNAADVARATPDA